MRRFVLAALTGFGVEALRQVVPAEPDSGSPTHFAFGFHKTGTVLLHHLCNFMIRATTANASADCAECIELFNVTREGSWCRAQETVVEGQQTESRSLHLLYSPSVKWYFGVPLYREREISENFREAYIIRDPLTAIVSAYIFDQKTWDHEGSGKEELQRLSLKDGLRLKCRDYSEPSGVLEKMVRIHKYKEMDARVLELRFEDFRTDYNTSARRLWRFMQGSTLPHVEQSFLDMAHSQDLSSWTPKRLAQELPAHVSDGEETQRALRALLQLCEEGDVAVRQALAFREKLGYPGNCSLGSWPPRSTTRVGAWLRLYTVGPPDLDLEQFWG